jgi:hypothetical protein
MTLLLSALLLLLLMMMLLLLLLLGMTLIRSLQGLPQKASHSWAASGSGRNAVTASARRRIFATRTNTCLDLHIFLHPPPILPPPSSPSLPPPLSGRLAAKARPHNHQHILTKHCRKSAWKCSRTPYLVLLSPPHSNLGPQEAAELRAS